MANFKTHTLISGISSSTLVGIINNTTNLKITDMFWLFFMGIIGGMLPDIDADNSKPVQYLFKALAFLVMSTAIIGAECRNMDYQSILLLAIASYIAIRYGVFFMFQKFTVHRGVFHSLLSAVFFGLLTVCIGYHIMLWDAFYAWLNGLFISFGFIVHLCLDELYSVDLSNARIKKSFGTALKLFSYRNLSGSVLLFIAILGLYMIAPPSAVFSNFWRQAITNTKLNLFML